VFVTMLPAGFVTAMLRLNIGETVGPTRRFQWCLQKEPPIQGTSRDTSKLADDIVNRKQIVPLVDRDRDGLVRRYGLPSEAPNDDFVGVVGAGSVVGASKFGDAMKLRRACGSIDREFQLIGLQPASE